MITAKLALLAALAQACSSVVPSIAPQPQTVVVVVHDSSPASRSKFLPNLRPNSQTKLDPALPWVAEFRAPAIYAEWWKEVGKCEGFDMPVELTRKVKFVEVNSNTFREATIFGETLYGLTDPDALTIILAQSKVLDKSVVSHEMAHQGAFWNGVDQGKDFHPFDLFENCGLHVNYP